MLEHGFEKNWKSKGTLQVSARDTNPQKSMTKVLGKPTHVVSPICSCI